MYTASQMTVIEIISSTTPVPGVRPAGRPGGVYRIVPHQNGLDGAPHPVIVAEFMDGFGHQVPKGHSPRWEIWA